MTSNPAMQKIIFIRIGIFFALLAAALALPWWVFVGASALVMIAYSAYELLALALFADLLYGVPRAFFFDMPFVFSLCVLVMLGIGIVLRRRVSFFGKRSADMSAWHS